MFKAKFFAFAFSVLMIVPFVSVHSLTVLVNTVQIKEKKDLSLDEKKAITAMENGIMDTLFTEGYIFFSVYLTEVSPEAMTTAKEANADYLLILNPDIETGDIRWMVKTVENGEITQEGTLAREDLDDTENLTEQEFYYKAGEKIAFELIQISRKTRG